MESDNKWDYYASSPLSYEVTLYKVGTCYDTPDESRITVRLQGGDFGNSRLRMSTSCRHRIIVGDVIELDGTEFGVIESIRPPQSDIYDYVLDEI